MTAMLQEMCLITLETLRTIKFEDARGAAARCRRSLPRESLAVFRLHSRAHHYDAASSRPPPPLPRLHRSSSVQTPTRSMASSLSLPQRPRTHVWRTTAPTTDKSFNGTIG
uniref:Uncharacterized protein n=1 Tax=Hyaloperonospora arabidopsidis (strain Emoy2) TaxID=559515 RepID=M4BI15_HYAAE